MLFFCYPTSQYCFKNERYKGGKLYMEYEIPLSIIKSSHGLYLLYFDVDQIGDPDGIYKAQIYNTRSGRRDGEAEVFLNEHLSYEDEEYIEQRRCTSVRASNASDLLCDVTQIVQALASGCVPNKGILIRYHGYIRGPRLVIHGYDDAIYPRGCRSFFEKELLISSFRDRAASPWFYSGDSSAITFFIENLTHDEIHIHIENSPNRENIVDDAQTLCIPPRCTQDIVPYKFSKFIRVTGITERHSRIAYKLWFQTQLIER